jgi:hypothetical protein
VIDLQGWHCRLLNHAPARARLALRLRPNTIALNSRKNMP